MTAATRQQVGVFRIACRGPGDLSGVQALVDSAALVPGEIVAVMGKTEGNGCVNDHTRDFAAMSWSHWLAPHLECSPQEAGRRVALVMSGGTEGVLSPHFTVFTRRHVPVDAQANARRLVLGIAHTRDFLPEEIGRQAQIDATALAVREAMTDAGIASEADVHFVQVKCPLLTAAAVEDAAGRVQTVATHDSYESMARSRGASALGVGVALGELAPAVAKESAVLEDFGLSSGRASCSAGIELQHNVVIVLGEAEGAASPFRIAHTVMKDAIDAAAVRQLLRDAFGLDPDVAGPTIRQQLVNLFAKAEASPDGRVRGGRHTMLDDSDIHSTRHARAAVGAVLASVAGQTELYVSGGAEHQGPAGGGPVAAIFRV